jgi:hypothetical protein
MNPLEVQERVDRLSARWVPLKVVWFAGLLWLSNVSWKVPPNFGETADGCRGLCRYVQMGIDHPVVPGSAWVFENVVQPRLEFFGWGVLFVEAALAALLLSGRYLRIAGMLGILQSLGIGLAVANGPDEWYWAYVLMVGVHLAVIFFAPYLRPLRARTMAAVAAVYGLVVVVAHAEAGFTGDGNDTWTLFTGGNDVPDEFGRGTFPGSIALGLVLVAVGVAVWVLVEWAPRYRSGGGLVLVVAAAILLLTYRSDGLALGLGSRAVTAAMLGAVGLSLTEPSRERAS